MQDSIIIGVVIAAILVVVTVIILRGIPSKAKITLRDVAPTVASHALTTDLHLYLYHLFELSTCNTVDALHADLKCWSDLEMEPVRIATGDNVVTKTEMPAAFSRVLQSYMNTRDSPISTYPPQKEYHFVAKDCVCRDAKLTVDGIDIAVKGLLVNGRMADMGSISWQTPSHNYRVEFLPGCTYEAYQTIPEYPLAIGAHSVDLRGMFEDVVDQGDLGSCSAIALARALGAVKGERYSALYLYWYTRVKHYGRDERDDLGADIPDLLAAMSQYGICREKLWPYNPKLFNHMPNDDAVDGAFMDARWELLKHSSDVKRALRQGRPVAVDINFDLRTWNNVPHNTIHEKADGEEDCWHSVVICGYDDGSSMYTIQNSYGKSWGDNGFARVPYSYLEGKNWSNAVAFRA